MNKSRMKPSMTTDESAKLSEHLSEHTNVKGWRVISNPTRQPDFEAGELKTLIQTMQARRALGQRKVEDRDPPEAA